MDESMYLPHRQPSETPPRRNPMTYGQQSGQSRHIFPGMGHVADVGDPADRRYHYLSELPAEMLDSQLTQTPGSRGLNSWMSKPVDQVRLRTQSSPSEYIQRRPTQATASNAPTGAATRPSDARQNLEATSNFGRPGSAYAASDRGHDGGYEGDHDGIYPGRVKRGRYEENDDGGQRDSYSNNTPGRAATETRATESNLILHSTLNELEARAEHQDTVIKLLFKQLAIERSRVDQLEAAVKKLTSKTAAIADGPLVELSRDEKAVLAQKSKRLAAGLHNAFKDCMCLKNLTSLNPPLPPDENGNPVYWKPHPTDPETLVLHPKDVGRAVPAIPALARGNPAPNSQSGAGARARTRELREIAGNPHCSHQCGS
ncbi:hypothetical protein BDV93DRAFT_559083 [Ceratobasidium sp. AG-I]|nr:hypothetical protein BDV93DRAFT_559083 [Ceratobasidium sp. AG-I]